MSYPPFAILIRVLVSDFQEEGIIRFLQELVSNIKDELSPDMEILGPAQAPIAKIKGRFRWQIILKGNDLNHLRRAVQYGLQSMDKGETSNTLRVIIDVEPQSIL